MVWQGKIAHNWDLFKTANRTIWSAGFVRRFMVWTMGINVINWVASWFIYHRVGTGLTVLHYNVDFGIDLVGTRGQIFINPLSGLVIVLINYLVLLLLVRHSNFRFIADLLLATLLTVNIILLLALLSLYLVNFR